MPARIRCWTSRHLSYAEKAVLVQSVLMSMHIYWASAFIISKTVIDELETLCRDFLWGSKEDRRRPALVAWDNLCLPELSGGIGLKNIRLWNVASLGKQVWAIMQKKDHLWVKWTSTIYLKSEDFMLVKMKSSDNWH